MVNCEDRSSAVSTSPLLNFDTQTNEKVPLKVETSAAVDVVCSSTVSCINDFASRSDETDEEHSVHSRVDSESWHNMDENQSSLMLRADAMLTDNATPAEIVRTLFPSLDLPLEKLSDNMVLRILSEILERPPSREKLTQYNTLDDAIELFRRSRKILILTGAGVSVSCGIPDFRSKDGIYARLHEDFPDLPDPTAMFDIRYFRHNPAPFYDFAKEIFPGQFKPSVSHKFIKALEDSDQLLRNYTQNIDTLEKQTGITRIIECHGSFSKATCLSCETQFDGDVIREDVLLKKVARCSICKEGLIKPNIVFFGEDLGQDFHRQMSIDKNDVDLVVVIGSSLKVRPVSLIPFSVDKNVPQILINREPLSSYRADVELLGNCDDIVREICLSLGGAFTEMIKEDDLSRGIGEDGRTCDLKKREKIDEEQFEKMMNANSKETEEDEEPRGKRARVDEQEDQQHLVANMYEQRYISIERQLPSDAYFQIAKNRSIFPGAELFYDLDTKTVCRRPGRIRSFASEFFLSDIEEDDDDESSSNSSANSRCASEPTVSAEGHAEVGMDGSSCHANMLFDSSLPVPAHDFRTLMQEMAEESE